MFFTLLIVMATPPHSGVVSMKMAKLCKKSVLFFNRYLFLGGGGVLNTGSFNFAAFC
jgi:hypothetical protein